MAIKLSYWGWSEIIRTSGAPLQTAASQLEFWIMFKKIIMPFLSLVAESQRLLNYHSNHRWSDILLVFHFKMLKHRKRTD